MAQGAPHSGAVIVVEVKVIVDVDMSPVASHLVMGVSHVVVHTSPCARLFGPPMVVVAVVVQTILQLLTVVGVHDEDEDSACVDVAVSEPVLEGSDPSFGTTSLSALSSGFKSSCRPLTVFTAAVVPSTTASFTLLVVSMTHVTSENTVLNKPPSRSRVSSTSCRTESVSLLRRLPDPHGSTPSVGFGSLPKKSTALGNMLLSSFETAVAWAAGCSIQFCRIGNIPMIEMDRSEALD